MPSRGSDRRRPEVDAWLEAYDNPMSDAVRRTRELFLEADPRISESVKWQTPTFSYKGNLASFQPRSKRFVSILFHQGAAIPGRHPRLEGEGDVVRIMRLADLNDVEAAADDIRAVVRAWCDWRDSH
jgi:hypothetical protein